MTLSLQRERETSFLSPELLSVARIARQRVARRNQSAALKLQLICTAIRLKPLVASHTCVMQCHKMSLHQYDLCVCVCVRACVCVSRNLSCAKEQQRRNMRECAGLINALMSYVQSCVAEDNPDDKVTTPLPFPPSLI